MNEAGLKNEMLLREYAEAGQITRHHEQLTRTSLSLFLPFFTLLAGYLLGTDGSSAVKLGLSVGGLAVAVLLRNTVLRLQAYYICYITRAKEIEKQLLVEGDQVIRLYTNGAIVKFPRFTVSKKTAIAWVLNLVAVYFFIAALGDATAPPRRLSGALACSYEIMAGQMSFQLRL